MHGAITVSGCSNAALLSARSTNDAGMRVRRSSGAGDHDQPSHFGRVLSGVHPHNFASERMTDDDIGSAYSAIVQETMQFRGNAIHSARSRSRHES